MTVELICPFCRFSKKVPKEKMPVGAKWATCPRCGQRFELSETGGGADFVIEESGADSGSRGTGGEPEKGYGRDGAPWENRSETGLWGGIYKTFKSVLFSPETFFSRITFKGGLWEPLAFGLLFGGFGSMLGLFWQFLMVSGALMSKVQSIFPQLTVGLFFVIVVVVIPVFVVLSMLIYSFSLHLLLLMVRGGKNGFEGTFRVVAYSQATQALALIPFLGGIVGGIWQIIVQIIGLREIHETSYLKVIIAFLIPVAVISLLVIAAAIAFFAVIGRQQLGQLWS